MHVQVPDADPVRALWLIKYDQLVGNCRNTVRCAGTIYQTRSELKVMRCGPAGFSAESHDFSRWECVKLLPTVFNRSLLGAALCISELFCCINIAKEEKREQFFYEKFLEEKE